MTRMRGLRQSSLNLLISSVKSIGINDPNEGIETNFESLFNLSKSFKIGINDPNEGIETYLRPHVGQLIIDRNK